MSLPRSMQTASQEAGAASMIDSTFEAVVLHWEGTTVPDLETDASGLRTRLESLSAAGVHVLVVSEGPPEQIDHQLRARPRGPGTLHLCGTRNTALVALTGDGVRTVFDNAQHLDRAKLLGPVIRESPDSPIAGSARAGVAGAPRYVAALLADRGITGELIMIVTGVSGPARETNSAEIPILRDAFRRAIVVSVDNVPARADDEMVHLGGGSDQVNSLLDEQLARRAAHRVPQIDRDPAWIVCLPNDPAQERTAEALGALSNGHAGTRGSWDQTSPEATPLFIVNGVYTKDSHRLPGPLWTGFDTADNVLAPTGERMLDLRSATLFCSDGPSEFRSLRLVSLASPQAMALRAEGLKSRLRSGATVRPPLTEAAFRCRRRGDLFGATTGDLAEGIAVAGRDRVSTSGDHRVVERLAAWNADPSDETRLDNAYEQLSEVEARGFDPLLAEHREAWARLWADAEVTIEGDPAAELAARFAVFHLLSAAPDRGEAAVGARGLTGTGYAGHVFWDADVFVLPALTAIRPSAARAMIEYRLRRLPAARVQALALGLSGARFPWESAADGTDVTPPKAVRADGVTVTIASGPHEEHVVSDVAWAAAHYASWTGDVEFLAGQGRPLLVETARYWASRVETDADGSGHIRGVLGPDEYHENVDDNAFTNVMARWNLRKGAALLARSGQSDEATKWRNLAMSLVDGWDCRLGLYEQFSGYFELEPLLMSAVGPPPIAADMLLGANRVAGSQLIKQADVLMAHHLVPAELKEGSLRPCLDFYEPRTAHGSSLSPAISASLLARAGAPDQALPLFRLAARLDLDNITGTTADGLHIATMGGLWQALAFGFLGMAAEQGVLIIKPNLPSTWNALALRLVFAGHPIGVRAERDHVTLTCVVPLLVRVGNQGPIRCEPGSTSVALAISPETKDNL